MKTWYRVDRYASEVTIVFRAFKSETKNFLITEKGHREAKRSAYDNWFPSAEEALQDAIEKADASLRAAYARLDMETHRRRVLGEAKGSGKYRVING